MASMKYFLNMQNANVLIFERGVPETVHVSLNFDIFNISSHRTGVQYTIKYFRKNKTSCATNLIAYDYFSSINDFNMF